MPRLADLQGWAHPASRQQRNGRHFQTRKEANVKRINWNAVMQSLVLIRLGQELGHRSDLAIGVASAIDFVLGTLARFLG